jgi:hypothetical protein
MTGTKGSITENFLHSIFKILEHIFFIKEEKMIEGFVNSYKNILTDNCGKMQMKFDSMVKDGKTIEG